MFEGIALFNINDVLPVHRKQCFQWNKNCIRDLVHDVATQCRTFAATRIQVKGNRFLDELTVIRQAGIHPQINVLAVRLNVCRQRLIAHPWIADASVRRRLPDALEIEIEEQRPLALAEMPAGRLLINTSGHPFKQWSSGDPEQLPVIRGFAYVDLPQDGQASPQVYAAALDLVRCWQNFQGGRTDEAGFTVLADRDTGISIEGGAGLGRIVLGFEHYPEKLANLHRLLQEVKPRGDDAGWRRIDLTQRQRIVVQPQGDSKEA